MRDHTGSWGFYIFFLRMEKEEDVGGVTASLQWTDGGRKKLRGDICSLLVDDLDPIALKCDTATNAN